MRSCKAALRTPMHATFSGKLWLVSGDGVLVGADARTGQVATTLDLGTPVFVAPVVAGGRMYILADNATLIALN